MSGVEDAVWSRDNTDSEVNLNDESNRPFRLTSRFRELRLKEIKCQREGINLPMDSNSTVFLEIVGTRNVKDPFSFISTDNTSTPYQINLVFFFNILLPVLSL